MEHSMLKSNIDTTILDNIIVGRVKPYIYAFSTETVPNYLKVGDTYRGVRVRLDEWRKIFPNLVQQYEHSAQIDDQTIFRDFAVHTFLVQDKKRERLQKDTLKHLPYYSNEFFKDATPEDVKAAIDDITQSYYENSGKYPLYSPSHIPQPFNYRRTESYSPRDNQKIAIENFKLAVEAGRTNLLLYAVMRFGKSYTSMCCAKEINARVVVIVSAKSDVKEEWKKTIQSHIDFEDYSYLDSEILKGNDNIISEILNTPKNKVALFLTLQDLQGDTIKEKHKEVFKNQIDLLIIDETHFGARGDSYGKVLQEQKLSKSEIKKEMQALDGFETLDRVEDAVKVLNARIKLHLSGTPYRILMSDEFQKEDIIAFVQFTDIIDAQKQWNDKYLNEDGVDEWDNPYYGFPQMIRFAFNPNESSRKKMKQMRNDGITHALSQLFRTFSVTSKSDGSHRQFKNESEILDLMEVIDGSKDDENLLGFLDYDKIKEGKMCRHIVCVLPFRSSCDAMSALLKKNKDKFKNLGDYEIINIAGFDDLHKYKSTDDVKRAIEGCEKRNKKTLTLTVNRMLTGTTVPQWDTMLYLKGTSSPQEYDQAIFRLQNQYITTFIDENGKTIKYNMKPQTLLVDFDPARMFILQERKSQYYNANTEVQGNTKLRERIARELEVSPIIVMNKDKLGKVTPTNITDAVREYSRNRSILDDASEIPTDEKILQDETLANILRNIEPIDSKSGLKIKPNEGEGNDIDSPKNKGEKEGDNHEDNEPAFPGQATEPIDNDNLNKRLAAYYTRILFFAFLTDSVVKSLEDIIIQLNITEDNRRIARNLGLNIEILSIIQKRCNPFVLEKVDYKIENINDLMRDNKLSPIKRVEVAMRKFGRMSESEIVTPLDVADKMVKYLPNDIFVNGPILDIASKQGEFTIALLKRYGNSVANKIYSVCTSVLAYEFTRKVYKLLALPIDHIFDSFTSFDLIKKDKDKQYIIPQEIKDMNFTAIIGNPPYQIEGVSTRKSPIYHLFYDVSIGLTPIVSFITPGRFLFKAGQTPKSWMEKMLADEHFKIVDFYPKYDEVFPKDTIDLKGGVAIGLRNVNEDFGAIGFFSGFNEIQSIMTKVKDHNTFKNNKFANLISNRGMYRFSDEFFKEYPKAKRALDSGTGNMVTSNSFNLYPEIFLKSEPENDAYIQLFGRQGTQRVYRWIKKSYILDNEYLSSFNVFIPEANGTGIMGEVLSTPLIGNPAVGHTDTFLSIGVFASREEAAACLKYIKTKFARCLLGTLKVTQHTPKDTWANVPMQDFTENSDIDWSKSVEEIDTQLYKKYKLNDKEITFIESMIKPME